MRDLRKAAGRIHGFLKNNPTPSPDQIRRWLELIEADERANKKVISRFDGFSEAMKKVLMRYEDDIRALAEEGKKEEAIESALKERFPFAKIKIPSKSTIRKFINGKS